MEKYSFRNDVLPLKGILYRLALRLVEDAHEAEDIVQDTMIKVWKRRNTWNDIDRMDTYCLTICRHLALDSIGKREKNGDSIDRDGAYEPIDTSSRANPEDRAVQQDRLRLVKRLMSQLPEKQRTAVQLREIEGKSYKEIAEIMEITEEQVKINIFRARQTIKRQFIKTDGYGL